MKKIFLYYFFKIVGRTIIGVKRHFSRLVFPKEFEDMMASRAELSLCEIIARVRGCHETKKQTMRRLFNTMSGLICWENSMPLARAAVYGRNPSIYLAPTADQRDGWQCSMRHIALEGRCFVLSCNQFVTKEMYPSDLACFSDLEHQP